MATPSMRCTYFSFLTDISSNEVTTFHQAMKQDDQMNFMTEMEKDIEDHETCGYWSIVKIHIAKKFKANQGNLVLQT